MRKRGIGPRDIDIVVSTHMHFDHIGWSASVRHGVTEPTFPNVLYVLPRLDWDALFDPDQSILRRVSYEFSEDAIDIFLTPRELEDRMKQIPNLELVHGGHSLTNEIVTVDTRGILPDI